MFQSGARWLWRIYRGISRSETWPGHPQPRQQRPGPGHKLKPRCQNHLLAFSIWVDKESENKFIDIYYTSSCFPSCNLDFSVFFKARKSRTQNTWPQQKCAVWLLFWSACLAVLCTAASCRSLRQAAGRGATCCCCGSGRRRPRVLCKYHYSAQHT